MSNERIERALKARAKWWHKATSFRAKPVTRVVSYRPTDLNEPCEYVEIPLEEAIKNAKEATKSLRYSYWKLAIKAGQTLLDLICEGTSDNRPVPEFSIEFNDETYLLQRVDGDNCTYVKMSLFDPKKVVYNPTSRRERIEREIVTMREMQANDMLTALTPSQNETEPEFA
jgi:hypothetical protein